LPKTFKIITDELKKNKIKYQVVDKYGIIVTINGKNKGKCILLRADMDGLPIEEESGVSYTSLHKGKMHACGHDSHSANLLGVLFILNKMKNEFNGTVKFMFQPAEEMSGGADHFIKAGILQNPKVDASLAIHQGNSGAGKNFKPGEIVVRYGCSNASVDDFKIEIIGKSGHAASPQKSINPIIIASNFITCAQNILTQKVSPDSLVILSFGSINGGSAPNIIPDKVELIGTLRTLDEDIRNKVMEEFKKLLEGICKLNGATYDLK
jgi:amidohydrolase